MDNYALNTRWALPLSIVLVAVAAPFADAAALDIPWYTIDGGGVMFSQGERLELSGTIGQPDAGVLTDASGRLEMIGGFWAGVSSEPACETIAPRIVHTFAAPAPAGSTMTSPCTGYIDPRIESDNGDVANLGVDEVVIVFSEPVYRLGAEPINPPDVSSFSIIETGESAPPNVAAVEQLSPDSYRVVLDQIITIGEWTTLRADGQDGCSNRILNQGDLGSGQTEPDRIDLAYLPGDINQDGLVSPQDLINLRQYLTNGSFHNDCEDVLYFDIDRDGVMPEPQDLIRFRQMIAGTPPATRSWTLETLNADQP